MLVIMPMLSVITWQFVVTTLAGILLLSLALLLIDYIRILKLRRTLPPGPFPWPIFGNHFIIPKSKPWIAFEAWSKYYGDPLLTIWLGRRAQIVIHDAWCASDLMEKRAALYASRPRMVAMGEMLGVADNNQTVLPYGDGWRLHRKLTVSG